MRKLLWIVPLLLVFASSASAYTVSGEVIAKSRAASLAYWHEAPPCGNPTVSYQDLAPTRTAEADMLGCGVIMSDQVSFWNVDPRYTCNVFIHEIGHLILGVNFFAAVNPTDPAHSPDPHNVMYASGGDVPGVCKRAFRKKWYAHSYGG